MAEIEPNAAEMAAARAAAEFFGCLWNRLRDALDEIEMKSLACSIASETRPRWTDERPTAADVGCVASFEWAIGGEDHGKIVQDDEGVLWLRAAIGRSLWIHDPHLRGRWCVYPKPTEVSDGDQG